ncbi:MAG: hypothetical protein RI985_2037 [Chloroflexota bacterium]|jgi:hypothetical protein
MDTNPKGCTAVHPAIYFANLYRQKVFEHGVAVFGHD